MVRKYYCEFIHCKSLGKGCTIPMSGEDCFTLGLCTEEKARQYKQWLRINESS